MVGLGGASHWDEWSVCCASNKPIEFFAPFMNDHMTAGWIAMRSILWDS